MNMKKTIILLLIATILSGIGVFFAFDYIQQTVQQQIQSHPQTQQQQPEETRLLVGIPKRVLQGTIITAQHIQALTVPLTATFDGDYIDWADRDSIIGHRLLLSLPSGAGLQYSDLVDSTYLLFSDQLHPGERAITIAVDPLNSHYGFLQPTDHIDIVLMSHSENTTPNTLLENIEVLATDTRVQSDFSQPELPNSGTIHTITLRVQLVDAQKLILAHNQGQLRILLRNQNDKTITTTVTATKAIRKTKPLTPKKPIELIIGGTQ